jgi:UDP-4-amino-4,6-dideoxy-N-acetyl-beta-L-altrosamine transaminase
MYIPYGRQVISKDDIQDVVNVLQSDFITQGPVTPHFENIVAEYCKVDYSVATNSATSALHIACLALGVKKGDHVWTSPITFVSSANCARFCGANIDFVDIDIDTINICPEELRRKLELANKKNCLPKVIVVVHMAGLPCDMKSISQLARQYNISIIEDASHAIGSRYKETIIGDCYYSDITIFSFHPVKIITTGEGGMATTKSSKLANNMKLLRSHGITRDTTDLINKSEGGWYYEQQMLGFNYRMTDIHSALGISQFKKLDEWIKRRNKLADIYDREFENTNIILPNRYKDSLHAMHLYIIQFDNKDGKIKRKYIYNKMQSAGIGVNIHYIPVHTQPYYAELGFSHGDFPVSEKYYERCLSLPMHIGLTNDQQMYIIKNIKNILQ